MSIVREMRESSGLTQSELAKAAGTSQSAVAAYESGAKVPSLRTLRRLARSSGHDVHVTITPPLTREDRRSLAFHRAIARKLLVDSAHVLETARQNLVHMRQLHPGAYDLLCEWNRILDLSLQQVVATLESPNPRARELRQVTPFAGVLDPAERVEAIRTFRRDEASRES